MNISDLVADTFNSCKRGGLTRTTTLRVCPDFVLVLFRRAEDMLRDDRGRESGVRAKALSVVVIGMNLSCEQTVRLQNLPRFESQPKKFQMVAPTPQVPRVCFQHECRSGWLRNDQHFSALLSQSFANNGRRKGETG